MLIIKACEEYARNIPGMCFLTYYLWEHLHTQCELYGPLPLQLSDMYDVWDWVNEKKKKEKLLFASIGEANSSSLFITPLGPKGMDKSSPVISFLDLFSTSSSAPVYEHFHNFLSSSSKPS